MCQEEARRAVDQDLEEITDQPSHQISSAGGLEQDWCRNNLSPFLHSAPEQRTQKPGSRKTWHSQLCLCGQPSLHLGQRGNSRGRSRGAHVSPPDSPMHVALSPPSNQESVLFFFCQFTMIVYVPPPPLPPWGGEEGHKALPAPLFLPWNCTR